MKAQIIIQTAEKMKKLGYCIASNISGGEIIALTGDLGSGKTTLAQGFLEYFGFVNTTSPTFVIDSVYSININKEPKEIHHVDFYRIEKKDELLNLGIYGFVGKPENIYIIEWFDRFSNLTDKGKLYIEIRNLGEQRKLTITSKDEKHISLFKNIDFNNF